MRNQEDSRRDGTQLRLMTNGAVESGRKKSYGRAMSGRSMAG